MSSTTFLAKPLARVGVMRKRRPPQGKRTVEKTGMGVEFGVPLIHPISPIASSADEMWVSYTSRAKVLIDVCISRHEDFLLADEFCTPATLSYAYTRYARVYRDDTKKALVFTDPYTLGERA